MSYIRARTTIADLSGRPGAACLRPSPARVGGGRRLTNPHRGRGRRAPGGLHALGRREHRSLDAPRAGFSGQESRPARVASSPRPGQGSGSSARKVEDAARIGKRPSRRTTNASDAGKYHHSFSTGAPRKATGNVPERSIRGDGSHAAPQPLQYPSCRAGWLDMPRVNATAKSDDEPPLHAAPKATANSPQCARRIAATTNPTPHGHDPEIPGGCLPGEA